MNGIAYVAKLSYSQSFLLSHYLYGCIAHYFQTHHVLHSAPPGSLMVRYFGVHTKCNNMGDVRKMIHEENVSELGCHMLANNHPEIILDDGKLDDARFNHLVAL